MAKENMCETLNGGMSIQNIAVCYDLERGLKSGSVVSTTKKKSSL